MMFGFLKFIFTGPLVLSTTFHVPLLCGNASLRSLYIEFLLLRRCHPWRPSPNPEQVSMFPPGEVLLVVWGESMLIYRLCGVRPWLLYFCPTILHFLSLFSPSVLNLLRFARERASRICVFPVVLHCSRTLAAPRAWL